MSDSTNSAPLIRLTDANYADGVGAAQDGTDPVTISAELFDQEGDTPNAAGLSNMFVAWGQFLDHDITLSLEGESEVLTAPGLVAPLHRSTFELDDDGTRIQTNAITWQIDGSQIYGSDDARTDDLRSFEGGKLRMSDDPASDNGLMPKADPDSFMAGDIFSDDPVFLAGDVRANENPALASLHTVMAREHNYWAERLAEENPDWDDDQLFDGARQIVTYELQAITYDNWLPHLIGDAAGDDTGYDPDVDGQISVEFSTAAFRFGHTMVSSTLPRLNADGTDSEDGDMAIRDAFFNADPLKDGQLDDILRGQMGSTAQEFDTKVVDDLNFFLESPGGLSGFSLVALNILRGRDHGLQNYIETRAQLLGDIDPDTLDPHDFSVITSDPDQQAALASVYDTIHDVDLWVGGLSEDPLPDTQMGPLFTHIVADQFMRIRAADPEFGQLDPALGDAIIAEVKSSTLGDILTRNTGVDYAQDDVFVAAEVSLTAQDAPEGCAEDDDFDIVSAEITGDIRTGSGDDTVTLRGGTKVEGDIDLGSDSDTYLQSSGSVSGDIRAGGGDDQVTLSGDAELGGKVSGGGGADAITLTDTATVGAISTGSDADTVSLGKATTTGDIHLGSGDDTITVTHGATTGLIDGGSDYDTLRVEGAPFRVDWAQDDPSTASGTVVFTDADGAATGKTINFREIENVTCFTAGTLVLTPRGEIPIEALEAGDSVITRDHGAQQVRWIGTTTVQATGDLAPIEFAAGAFGNSTPLLVSPQHRMLLSGWRCDMVAGTKEALAPAKHLINDRDIRRAVGGTVTYIHLAFDQHEIITAGGVHSESFHPGHMALDALAMPTRAELLRLFPDVRVNTTSYGPSARPQVKPYEARLIRP